MYQYSPVLTVIVVVIVVILVGLLLRTLSPLPLTVVTPIAVDLGIVPYPASVYPVAVRTGNEVYPVAISVLIAVFTGLMTVIFSRLLSLCRSLSFLLGITAYLLECSVDISAALEVSCVVSEIE